MESSDSTMFTSINQFFPDIIPLFSPWWLPAWWAGSLKFEGWCLVMSC